jgi:hypothetical protein
MRVTLGGAALISAVCYGGWIRADEIKCAATRALPGAQERELADLVVIAPIDMGWRICFWNSPNSQPSTFVMDFDGIEIGVRIEVLGSLPEILHIDLPGAIITDLDGIPMLQVTAPDGGETEALLLPWVM